MLKVNPRLKDLAIKTASHMLENLNNMDLDQVKRAIENSDKRESIFDAGTAQFLRLYLGARMIGDVTRSEPSPNAGSGNSPGAGAKRPKAGYR